jgi:hypothetical protein
MARGVAGRPRGGSVCGSGGQHTVAVAPASRPGWAAPRQCAHRRRRLPPQPPPPSPPRRRRRRRRRRHAFLLTPPRAPHCLPDPPPAADPEPDAPEADASGSEAPGLSRPSSSGGLTDADLQPPPGVSWKRSKSKRKLADKKRKDADYYALLGLQNERWMANDNAIKLGARRSGGRGNFRRACRQRSR